MGESAYYRVGGVEVYSLRNRLAAFPYAMEVFDFSDWVDEAGGVALGDGFPRSEDEEGFLGFRTTCAIARKRLDVQGYTLDRAFEAFRRCAKELNECYEEDDDGEESDVLEDVEEQGHSYNHHDVSVDVAAIIPDLMDSSALLSAYRQILSAEAMQVDRWSRSVDLERNPIRGVNAFADVLIATSPYSLLGGVVPDVDLNPLFELRVMLEVVPEGAMVEYDCKMVLRYWDSDIELLLKDYLQTGPLSESSKTIILTEGVTDDEFLKSSFEALMPEVAHLFRFFGYHAELSPERSADALKKIAMAAASVGLSERFVFLFDNDAVGSKCWNEVRNSLPSNMIAIRLPDVELAKSYPTYGPHGYTNDDVNGRAVTIELFLGEEALSADNGSLRLVHWGQQVNGVYQASFSKEDKNAIQESFRSAVASAKRDGLFKASYDWKEMLSLLNYICECSSSLPPVIHDSLLLHV